jgi:hypothetical protein
MRTVNTVLLTQQLTIRQINYTVNGTTDPRTPVYTVNSTVDAYTQYVYCEGHIDNNIFILG